MARDETEETDILTEELKTPLARRLQKLKNSSVNAAVKRENLPHQLFWSLFHGEIKEIRRAKQKQRVVRNIFLGIKEE
jgi:hypothetical protein